MIEGEAGEGIFVAETEAVELRASEGSSLGEFELGVAEGMSVAVAETVELTASEGSSEPARPAVGAARLL